MKFSLTVRKLIRGDAISSPNEKITKVEIKYTSLEGNAIPLNMDRTK